MYLNIQKYLIMQTSISLVVLLTLSSTCWSQPKATTAKEGANVSTNKSKQTTKQSRTVLSPEQAAEISARRTAIASVLSRARALLNSNRWIEAKQLLLLEIPKSSTHRGSLTDLAVDVLIRLGDYSGALVLLNHPAMRGSESTMPDLRASLRSWLQCKVGHLEQARMCRNERVVLNVLEAAELPEGYVTPPVLASECERMAALAVGVHLYFFGKTEEAGPWFERSLNIAPDDAISNFYFGLSITNNQTERRNYLTRAMITAPPGLARLIKNYLRSL